MKLIVAVLMFVVAVVVTGGLYLFIRKDEQKKSDLDKLQSILRLIAHCVRQVGNYLSSLFGSRPEETVNQPSAESTAPAP